MTHDERIAFLNEHPCNSRWDLVGDRRRWTVTTFPATGHGATFTEALDDAIGVYQARQAEAVAKKQALKARRWLGRKAVLR